MNGKVLDALEERKRETEKRERNGWNKNRTQRLNEK